jgi:hypothetical protein
MNMYIITVVVISDGLIDSSRGFIINGVNPKNSDDKISVCSKRVNEFFIEKCKEFFHEFAAYSDEDVQGIINDGHYESGTMSVCIVHPDMEEVKGL